ncbi:MAG: Asp-tRNA(Asn)/Glu-tRNA(Gln) amidotransferase subunit GatB [Traorella sp.]
MNFETIIGIEIHCELKTKTKMFSAAPVAFGSAPNSCVNEIDLGMPGCLPCLNKHAVELALRACMGTHCEIDPLVKFDRKNYYYSDLPKGFQITQQFHPIGKNGYIEITTDQGIKKIRLNRIHMEEDTAKQFHTNYGSLLDFNRAGTPLIEIVSEPDMRSGKEAAAYVENLKNMLYYLGVSDCKMEEGSMRCDVNISIRPYGYNGFGTKTEIKNLNSISNVQKAIEYEVERQKQVYESGNVVEQETRRFDEMTKTTVLMRKKEGNVDYKFFPEPNIFPILLDEDWIQSIRESQPELPSQRKTKYMEVYGLSEYDASTLIQTKELSDFYDEVVKHTKEYKLASNWCLVELMAVLNKDSISFKDNPCKPEYLADMIEMITKQEISSKQAKVVFEEIMKGKDPQVVVIEKSMKQISDPQVILELVNQVLDANPQAINDFKNGKNRAQGALVGQIMKLSKGQANPKLTNQILNEELKKR